MTKSVVSLRCNYRNVIQRIVQLLVCESCSFVLTRCHLSSLFASDTMAVHIKKVCAINNRAVNFISSVQAMQEYCDRMA
jgi:hypothetical protein